MNWPCPIRVVGVGGPAGDDALGWEVIRSLRERQLWQPDIEFLTLAGGQRLLDVLDGHGTLVLIDAVERTTAPGTIHRFDYPDQRIDHLRPGSTHDMGPVQAIGLAAALAILPPRVVIYGIELESTPPQGGLTPAVVAAVSELVQRLANELTSPSQEGCMEGILLER
jgi:hydrogenase maturation protease